MADNLDRTKIVFDHVAAVQDVTTTFGELLAKPDEVFPFDREMLELIKIVMENNTRLITDLFEENQYIYDLVERAMRKNHPKDHAIEPRSH